jgi:hypothetical protein
MGYGKTKVACDPNYMKAKEILDYILTATQVSVSRKQYVEMAKEIKFMIETS